MFSIDINGGLHNLTTMAGFTRNIPLHGALLALLFLGHCAPEPEDRTKYLLLAERYEPYRIVENGLNDSLPYDFRMYEPTDYDNISKVNLSYTLELGDTPRDVYFLFTNVSTSSDTSYPAMENPSPGLIQGIVPETLEEKTGPEESDAGIRGKPEVREFNRNPFHFLSKINPVTLLLGIVPPPEQRLDESGNPGSFKIDSRTSLNAHCRLVRPVNTAQGLKTLNIWVADNCWHIGGTKTPKVTPAMVEDIADKFLQDGDDNDIYDWVTGIFGEEWSGDIPAFAADLVIPPNDEITILLYDIDNDNSTTGGILGYFWAKDNFKKSEVPYSNERIMFYMDALLLATPEGAWDISDRWPAEIISALAHELQHMIHFHQKNILRAGGAGTETWIDEMCSLTAEDLVSKRMAVNGPRGALHSSAACVPASDDPKWPLTISRGRIPLFNYYNEYSVTRWYDGSNVLVSYALNYALGSYLARNFGGAAFFRKVVWNPYTDEGAVEYALEQNGAPDAFGTILRKWSIANLLSDALIDRPDYRYNNEDAWFSSFMDALEYNVGSIDLYRYTYTVKNHAGPYIYTTMPSMPMQPASTIYYRAAAGHTGTRTWNIKMKSNVRLTVLIR
ncbi:MAG: hypothetical protein JW838_01900 [Spirochaetes bacterium]|nr:hypothetical protein [Spirochaetota bacterium]